ncbi:hypothetical protein TD95_002542 [Thielaviopsis punctulata]|uniref:MTHFR SAM-binding regulatory domain-containing protein n=1 Tax=Thielaviopsis punctulata TaxID=72032 RepID=A0A0F4ZED8_9PEZI|nr:hypothetical protein TD95_002542 [Thielaviopsis punctulata]
MDKITDKIAALPADANYFSLEFFPPKTDMGFSNLRNRLDRMERALHPLFVNVTWGAGGSTAQKSLQLAETCQRELGLTTCLHLTCTNMSRRLIDKALEDAKVLGIRNILALRGDPPRKAEYADSEESSEDIDEEYCYAVDLVRHIRKNHGDYFCIGVAAYPEGHADGSHPTGQTFEHDLPWLVEKVQAGADFIMTQLFFDVSAYEHFEKTLRNHPSGAFATIPIIPGLMPIQSYQMIKRTTKLSHAKVPESLMARLDAVKGDDEQVKSVGVDILSEIIERIKGLKTPASAGPRGFHFYTLNLEKAVSLILEKTGLIPDKDAQDEEEAIIDDDIRGSSLRLAVNGSALSAATPAVSTVQAPARRLSSLGSDPRNRVIVSGGSVGNSDYVVTAQDATFLSKPINTRANTLAASEGEGVLGREVTWDDFPNGRWGDARSPAYGEIDGYGVSLHMTPAQALQHWGYPVTTEDINALFLRHIRGDLAALPWSEEELRPESSAIQTHLEALDARGWWTVASQPAVNGVKSTDATFGWGPANGFVFQKAFVEFFVPRTAWTALREKLTRPDVKDHVCWYASNAAGDFTSSDRLAALAAEAPTPAAATENSSSGPQEPSTNAVTWGVFPGKEIVTPTIIEEVSFCAWSEEAFGIWGEWARVYPAGTASARLLEGIRREYYLVNVIHHDFVDKEALWELLLKE